MDLSQYVPKWRGTAWIVDPDGRIGARVVLELPAEWDSVAEWKARATSRVLIASLVYAGYTVEFGPIGPAWQS